MNNYNPTIHHRRSVRLKGYDYSQAGLYFITICCDDRKCRFGIIENYKMELNEFGTVAYNEWVKLPQRFPNVELDFFQIMPNHLHGIISLQNVGAGFTPTQNDIVQNDIVQNDIVQNDIVQNGVDQNDIIQKGTVQNGDTVLDGINRAGVNPAPTATIGNIVGAYKSLVTNACIDICNTQNVRLGKLWQRNYYEHIIRNEQSYHTIANYIINNPAKWHEDKFYII